MFGIGGIEFAVIALLALLLLGPDKIPEIARTIGRFTREFKKYQAMMESTFRAEMLLSEQEAATKKAQERVAAVGEQAPAKIPGEVGYEPKSMDEVRYEETAQDPAAEELAESERLASMSDEEARAYLASRAEVSEEDNPEALFDPDEPGWTPGAPGSPGMTDGKEDGEPA